MAGYIEVELNDVFDGLDAMVRAGRDLRPVWQRARKDLRDDLKQHFDEAKGPDGTWAPRAQSSIDRILRTGGRRKNVTKKGVVKKRAARRLKNQLGRLRTAWRITYNARQIEAASIVKWAGVHQWGGTAGRGSRIPARPFAWASDALVGKIAVGVRDHIARGWQK
jgi:phage gpG-like protein